MHTGPLPALRSFLVLSALAVAGCTEAAGPTNDQTGERSNPPAFELYATGDRLDPSYVNAHVYGSFRISAAVEGPASVILSGPANFPGHPAAGPGTCENGTWINANGRRTAGTIERPHPHCLQSSATMEVVLEPISACYTAFNMPLQADCLGSIKGFSSGLRFGTQIVDGAPAMLGLIGVNSKTLGVPSFTKPLGTSLTGYAIDASTLGTTNRRVGTLTIDMLEFSSSGTNILPANALEDCSMDASLSYPCIDRVVVATYNPLPEPAGVGIADTVVEGFLWMAANKVPYNY